jgi:hypothetical protein
MSILIHVIIAACYSVLALGVGLMLPAALPQVSEIYAGLAAAAVMAGGLVLHLAFVMRLRSRRIHYQIEDIHRQTRRLAEDLLETQTQSLHWRQAAEQMGKAGEHRVSQVISEVKVLQGLIETFAEQQTRYARATSGGGPRLVAMEGGF